jgi:exopolysaccharide biosynthesis polyprenyl glycosylphosphotransferase
LIDEDTDRVNQDFFGIKCIGSLKDIPNILDHQHVDEVVIVVPRMWLNRIQETITTCELRGVKVSIAGDLFELNLSKPGQGEEMEGFPLLTFVSKIDHDWELFFKRLIDITACLGGLIVLSVPLMIVILLVKITSPGPIFYRQKRVGLHGRLFNMHKFRTMYTDAAERFEKVKHLNEVDGPVFKIKNDPRITPLGRVLRKFSIDELPQLWDVLVGNMSLVGPRPGLASELANFEPWMLRRLTMRPGLTCLWQIMGRNNIDFKTWMELDLRYIDNWSLWLDMTILFKTIPVVVKAQGAS